MFETTNQAHIVDKFNKNLPAKHSHQLNNRQQGDTPPSCNLGCRLS